MTKTKLTKNVYNEMLSNMPTKADLDQARADLRKENAEVFAAVS